MLLLVFPFISFSQIVAENELYKVVYSEFYQQPISLNYKYPNPFEYKSTIILEKKVIPELKIFIPKDSIALIEQKININSNGYYVCLPSLVKKTKQGLLNDLLNPVLCVV